MPWNWPSITASGSDGIPGTPVPRCVNRTVLMPGSPRFPILWEPDKDSQPWIWDGGRELMIPKFHTLDVPSQRL